jgi:serine/threonine protein kinase
MLIGGRFRLIMLLGEGGMGRVWRGRDEVLGRDVAVKEVLLPSETAENERTKLIARMNREAESAACLNHPGIVTIHDVIEHERVPWIVMEYVPGTSLGSILKRDKALPLHQAAAIGAKLADALAHAHNARIVHRDLKPDNILVAGDRVVIADFGLALPMGTATRMTSANTVMGTVPYMAPEQLEDLHVGPAADLWALGVTLYQAIEGRLPFHGSTVTALTNAILNRAPAPPSHAGPLSDVLTQLLAKDPARRPTAAALTAMLSGSAGASPVRPATSTLRTAPSSDPVPSSASAALQRPMGQSSPRQRTGPATRPFPKVSSTHSPAGGSPRGGKRQATAEMTAVAAPSYKPLPHVLRSPKRRDTPGGWIPLVVGLFWAGLVIPSPSSQHWVWVRFYADKVALLQVTCAALVAITGLIMIINNIHPRTKRH